jgi:hypothetical protein
LEAAHRLSPPDHRRIVIARGPHLAGALRQFGECHVPQTRNHRSGCYAAVRNTVYLSPGLRVGYGNVSGFASVGVPVVNHMNGQQSKPDYRVVTGVAATF